MADHTLSNSWFTAIINVPAEDVDIARWLLGLPDAEYQRCCPPDHIAAGISVSDDDRPMSITVEQIGDGLVIQHYIAELLGARHCKMLSRSDVYTPHGRTVVNVTWDLSVEPIDASHCRYTNSILATTTPEFLRFLDEHGIALADAAAARQAASSDHNRRATPRFAACIERQARTRSLPADEHGVALH